MATAPFVLANDERAAGNDGGAGVGVRRRAAQIERAGAALGKGAGAADDAGVGGVDAVVTELQVPLLLMLEARIFAALRKTSVPPLIVVEPV